MRISWFTRTSCEPLMMRLPFSRIPVTTAATSSVSFSDRFVLPLAWVSVSEPYLMLESASGVQPRIWAFAFQFKPLELVRLRSVSLSKSALSLIWMLTVRMSPMFSARRSLKSAPWLSLHNE